MGFAYGRRNLENRFNSTGESHVQNMGKIGWREALTAMLSELVAHFMTPR